MGKNSYEEKTQNRIGFISSEHISAGFSMQVCHNSKADSSFDYFHYISQPIKYSNVLLIKPSIAAKRERRDMEKIIMDCSRMTMADQSNPTWEIVETPKWFLVQSLLYLWLKKLLISQGFTKSTYGIMRI